MAETQWCVFLYLQYYIQHLTLLYIQHSKYIIGLLAAVATVYYSI